MSAIGEFSSKLKSLRKEKHLQQGELAKELGVSRGSISFYENGDRIPDIEFLSKVSAYFSVSADWLLGLTKHKTKDASIRYMCDFLGLQQNTLESLHSTISLEYAHRYFDSLVSERELILLNKSIKRAVLASVAYNHQSTKNIRGPLMMEEIADMEPEEYKAWKEDALAKLDEEEKRFDRDLEAGECIYIGFDDAASLFADRASGLLDGTLRIFIDDISSIQHENIKADSEEV